MEWWNILLSAAGVVAGILIKWAVDKIANKYADAALEFLNEAIAIGVTAANQVYVDAIKAASEDGTLTDEEKRQAKSLAWDYVFKQLPPKFIEALKKMFGTAEALNTYVDTGIEAAVKAAKEGSL